MAEERRYESGRLAAWHIAAIANILTGEERNPEQLNPFRKDGRKATAALRRLEQWQARRVWRAMHTPKAK